MGSTNIEVDSVAIVLDAESAPLIVPRTEAVELHNMYAEHTLVHEEDKKLFGALQMALGTFGPPELGFVHDEMTWAEKKLQEWSKKV